MMKWRPLPGLPVAILALLLLPLAAAAQQPGPGYLGPALQRLLGAVARQAAGVSGRFDLLPANAPLPMARQLAVDRNASGRAEVGLFVEAESPAAVDALRARGARIGTVVRSSRGTLLLTARVPLDQAGLALRAPGLRAAYAAPRIELRNDSGVHAIHADEVRQRSGSNWLGSTGQGVIVGIYDTGLDFRHGDFLDGAGHTRVVGLWDQTRSGSPPGLGYYYGNYCSPAMIQLAIGGNAASCTESDTHGHGTHVAGSAAGNGAGYGTGTPYQFAGVAPAADIAIVKGGNGTFSFDQIVDGIGWIDSLAVQRREPAVVNLSLGGQGGPHDGTSVAAQMIDALARPGFAVVVAAGNDGFNANSLVSQGTPTYFHAMGMVSNGTTASFSFIVPQYTPSSGSCQNGQDVDMWYGGGDRLTITVIRPDGTFASAVTGDTVESDAPGGEIYINNANAGPDPQNGDLEALVEISDCGASGAHPALGTWIVRVTGSSVTSSKPFHAWLENGSFGGASATAGAGFDNRYVVGTPGTARSVITVGAFTTKQSWITASGPHYYVDRTALGDLADFSSAGPTRDERQKPEIAAPGAAVVSSLSSTAQSVNPLQVAADGTHWALEGTSMATPHVTGAVALMLQSKPEMTADQLKTVFAATAMHDGFTSRTYGATGSPQDWWGAGKLNVKAALLALGANPLAVASVTLSPHADTLPHNASERFTVLVANALGVALDSAVSWTSSNAAVATVDGTGLVRAVGNGTAWIGATAGGRRDSAAVVVVPPATLAITGTSLVPAVSTLSGQGTRLPLLALRLRVDGFEAMRVSSVAFDVVGDDPAARVALFPDADGSGTIAPGASPLVSVPVALPGGASSIRVTLSPDSLQIAAHDSTALILAVVLSGQVPNGSAFSATLAPQATHTLGVRSQATDQLGSDQAVVASGNAATTVLGVGENFALSENPVRHGHVVFNFSTRPTTAGVYTLSGRRVTDLLARMTSDGRVDWTLRNDDGALVVNGIYLVVFDVGGQVIRRKLFIARPQE